MTFGSREADPAQAPQLTVSYSMGDTSTTNPCAASLTQSSGSPFCQQGQQAAAEVNKPLPANAALDPNSAGIAAALNAGAHNASYGEYGTRVFDASVAGTRPSEIACTQTGWGTCPLTGRTLPIHDSWKPSPGSDRAMLVIDYGARKVYDFWRVETDADGTVKLNADGTIRTAWGDVSDLDGSGQAREATGSGLSHMYGMGRVFQAQKAVNLGGCTTETDCRLADVFPHALHFATNLTCPTYRAPATKSDGHSTDPNCVQHGTRVFLDDSTNCAFDATKPIEEAVCFALKRYGAFVTDTAGTRFSMGFEGATSDQPGGSGSSPYAAGGLKWDYYDMKSIPWQRLRVAAR